MDSALGLTSACAACHSGTSTSQLGQTTRALWGEVKPLLPAVAAQMRVDPGMPAFSAAALLLGDTADAGERHAFARFAGVSRFLETYVHVDRDLSPEVEARLRELAASTDEDVRAAALATLHLAKGTDRGVRRLLAAALRAANARDAALDVNEPLAWFNLANLLYVQRDMDRARTMYERVVALDPSILPAHFQLARVSLVGGDSAAALRHLRRGLAFDSTDAQARQMAAFLTNRPASRSRTRP